MRSTSTESTGAARRVGGARCLLLALASGLASIACDSGPPPRPHIVLITIDTLRADHLGAYGYERPTSPNIDALAATGIRFDQAQSQAPWTLPSMASVHTSLYPREHGADSGSASIDERSPALAQRLADTGYRTVAVVSHYFVKAQLGFARGFQIFDESEASRPESAVNSPRITEIGLEQFGDGGAGPTFLWVHYFDPHQDWVRHRDIGFSSPEYDDLGDILRPPFVSQRLKRDLNAGEIQHMIDVYDEEIAYTDRAVGTLIDGLRQATDRPIIFVVTADHGEFLMERGRFGHGVELYPELLRVPLILGGDLPSDLRGVVVRPYVETRSVAKTILGIAGAATEDFDGADLIPIARGAPGPARVFSEGTTAYRPVKRRSLVMDGFKMIVSVNENRRFARFYDLSKDPEEMENLWWDQSHKEQKKRMVRILRKFDEREVGRGKPITLDEDERRRLEALGYVAEETEPATP